MPVMLYTFPECMCDMQSWQRMAELQQRLRVMLHFAQCVQVLEGNCT